MYVVAPWLMLGKRKEIEVALQALAYPIPPGGTDDWRRFMAELNGPRRADYEAWTQQFGARWRVFSTTDAPSRSGSGDRGRR